MSFVHALHRVGLGIAVAVLAVALVDGLASSAVVRYAPGLDALALGMHLLFAAIFVAAVSSRVYDILRGEHRASRHDLLFFLTVYLATIVEFGLCYLHLDRVMGAPAFAVAHPGPPALDFIYYSTVTFTTLGFGDITAIHWLSRMLTAMQGILGQLMLIVGIGVVLNSATKVQVHDEGTVERLAGADQPPVGAALRVRADGGAG